MWKLLSSVENVKMSGFRRKKSCQLFIEVERIWIASSVPIVTNWLKHQKLVKEVFILHMTMAIYDTKNHVIWSHLFEVKSITLQNTAIFLKELRVLVVSDNANGRCMLISNTTAKGMRLARFLMEKLHFFRWSHVININATVAKVNI